MRTLIRIVALFTLLAGTMLATGQASAQSVVSIADATVTEGVSPAQTIISMTNPTGLNCQVAVTSVDGSAVAPDDYTAFSGGHFNLIGVASDVLSISVIDDGFVEGPETFTINIALTASSDPQCQLGDSTATITIADDEPAAPAGSVSIPTNHPLALLLLALTIGWTALRRRGGQ